MSCRAISVTTSSDVGSSRRAPQNHCHVAFGLELESRVSELDANARAPRLRIDVRVDERDTSFESACGLTVRKLDLRLLTRLHGSSLVLEDLRDSPDGRQVGNLGGARLGRDVLPGISLPFEHDAIEG